MQICLCCHYLQLFLIQHPQIQVEQRLLLFLLKLVFDFLQLGEKNGIKGILNQRRNELWMKKTGRKDVPTLSYFNCQDHVLNLMSSGSLKL